MDLGHKTYVTHVVIIGPGTVLLGWSPWLFELIVHPILTLQTPFSAQAINLKDSEVGLTNVDPSSPAGPLQLDLCSHYAGYLPQMVIIPCDQIVRGRYLVIHNINTQETEALNVCEVEAYYEPRVYATVASNIAK